MINTNPTNPLGTRDTRRPEGGIRISRSAEPSKEESAYLSGREEMPPVRVRRSSKGAWVLVVAIVIVLLVLGVIFRDRLFGPTKTRPGSAEFQAVFLTNGQVYFGKLSDVDSRYVELENIYYLQITPVLQTKTEGEPGTQASAQQQQLSLVKLGNELHGPVDRMKINRDQVLFFEDLKSDGRVVQAIKQFEEGQKK